jgi:hypothetical protein
LKESSSFIQSLPPAENARQRIAHLRLELKGRENKQAVKLGEYEQNIGLKRFRGTGAPDRLKPALTQSSSGRELYRLPLKCKASQISVRGQGRRAAASMACV